MRIALVIFHADPARGGAERYTADLAASLAARGHHVDLLACSFGAPLSGVHPVQLDAHGLTRTAAYLRFLDSLDAHRLSRRYDVVHAMLPVRRCDLYHPHAGLAAEAVATGHLKHPGAISRSFAAIANRLNRKRRTFARVEHQLLTSSRPPVVLCLSDYVKSAVRRHYPLAPRHMEKLFNAVDLQRFDPDAHADAARELRARFNLPADRVVALMIAQDYRRKGLPEAIEAVAQVKDPRLALLVVGKEKTAPWQIMARRLGVGAQVIFAGPTDNPAAFYAAADFFVLPTRHDPCSLVVLEALAMGLPVITTRFNGAAEAMTPSQHGLILDSSQDVGKLAEAMRQLLDDSTRRAMRAACQQLRPALSWDHHLDQLQGIYHRARPTAAIA